ncbi:MAG TPA: PEP/pyruvate-binding domain-containing protein, partial [bacterium]|nr:PEP/pyruvate-binding domain-containing protein [bacterium]
MKRQFPIFDRRVLDGKGNFTVMGGGEIGGKAAGLALLNEKVLSSFPDGTFFNIRVDIPRLTVITSSFFDAFMAENNLYDIAYGDYTDERIAHHFQKADLPAMLLGDLRALIARTHEPLAIRSSSLLEDAMFEPFAGIYGTKMIPNNRPETDERFRQLVEAVKFVYASTFFSEAKNYIQATSNDIRNEKMCVIIQEVVGMRVWDYFFPMISGVGRSYNFYPSGRARPEQGVVDLALGLGKSIVDGGFCWNYSPAFPRAKPPFGSNRE